MKCVFAVSLFLALAARASAADTTNSLPIPGHGRLAVATPPGWTFVPWANRDTNDAQQVNLTATNHTVALQLKIYWDGFGPYRSHPAVAEMTRTVEKIAREDYAPVSVEKKGVIEIVAGPGMKGCFARFTETRWATNAPPPGEYANVATGMLRCDGLWGFFTLFTNDKDGPQFKLGMSVVESLRQVKPE